MQEAWLNFVQSAATYQRTRFTSNIFCTPLTSPSALGESPQHWLGCCNFYSNDVRINIWLPFQENESSLTAQKLPQPQVGFKVHLRKTMLQLYIVSLDCCKLDCVTQNPSWTSKLACCRTISGTFIYFLSDPTWESWMHLLQSAFPALLHLQRSVLLARTYVMEEWQLWPTL